MTAQEDFDDLRDKKSRRGLIEGGAAAAIIASLGLLPGKAAADVQIQYGSGTFSGNSVVNGVLSAYGLPQFPDAKGFTPFLQQFKDTVVQFQYPSSWVVNNKAKFSESGLKNGQTGVTVSDYRTAEGLTLYTQPVGGDIKSIDQLSAKVVADLVVDGGTTAGSGTSGYKLVKEGKLPEDGYRIYIFSWESFTVSGYEVQRVGVCAATVKKGVLYALQGVIGKPRSKVMLPVLQEVAASFRVFNV